jgi:hypothetical protein
VHLLLAPVPLAEKIDAAVLERPLELRQALAFRPVKDFDDTGQPRI